MGNIQRMGGNICPICGKKDVEIFSNRDDLYNYYYYNCPHCGEFFASKFWHFEGYYRLEVDGKNAYDEEKLKSYLFYHKGKMRPFLVKEETYAQFEKDDFCDIYNLSPAMVEAWYPKTFAEKVDKILLHLAHKTKYMGEELDIHYQDLAKIYFITHKPIEDIQYTVPKQVLHQIDYFNVYFESVGLLTFANHGFEYPLQWKQEAYPMLTPKGWGRIDELQKMTIINKNIFVSMAFNGDTKDTREAIRQGIINAKHSPEFLDEIIHNRQIVPEMFRLIRESRFLILEISDPNYGAYYEAGYALGLNKEVIVCCRRDVFERKDYDCDKDKDQEENQNKQNKEDKKCWYMQKALKPHFDILQKQILIWDDYADLTKKLEEWIRELSSR